MNETPGEIPEGALAAALRAQALHAPNSAGPPATADAGRPNRRSGPAAALLVLLFALFLGLVTGGVVGALTIL